MPIIGCFVLLALTTNITVPIFDAPDEPSHFAYSRLLAQGKGLPVQTDPARRAEAEGFNPPLYYGLGALILSVADSRRGSDITLPPEMFLDWDRTVRVSLLDALDRSLLPPRNPQFYWWEIGNEPNRFQHPPDGPFSAAPLLAVNAMRLLSLLCGVITLVAVARLSQVLLPDEPAGRVLALATVAFNPQFVFLSSVLNNDNLATTAATLTLWRLCVALRRKTSSLRDAALIGALLGIGLLAKPSIFFLLLPATVVVFFCADTPKKRVAMVATVVALALAISGWFYVRNALIYGDLDFLGWNTRLAIQPHYATAYPPDAIFSASFVLLHILRPAFESFWGWFGWMTMQVPSPQMAFYALVSLLSVGSVGVFVARTRHAALRKAALLFWSCVGLNVLSLVTFNRMFFANQGRLLFPSIGAVALLIAIGFIVCTSKVTDRARLMIAIAISAAMLLLAVSALVQVLGSVYF